MSTISNSLSMENMGKDFSGGNNPFYMQSDGAKIVIDKDFFKEDSKSVNIYNDPLFAVWGEIDNRSIPEAAKLFMNENVIKPTKKALKVFGQTRPKMKKRKQDMVF